MDLINSIIQQTKHKDKLCLEMNAYIGDAFYVKKDMTIDNLCSLESRYLTTWF